MPTRNRRNRKGSALFEFALVSTILIPLFFGTVGLGVNMGKSTQTLQLARDLGHMYANTVDFSTSAAQNLAVQLATGTGMTVNGGNAVVVLSQIITVYQADCTAAGVGSCTNLGKQAFINRIVIGNAGLAGGSSRYGTPNSNIVTASGNIGASNYLTNSSAIANNFSNVLASGGFTQSDGDVAYLAEVYVLAPDTSYLGNSVPQGIYSSFVF